MWPKYLRTAAAAGVDALADTLLRSLAIAAVLLAILGIALLNGGAAFFCGILVVLFAPVIVWPRLFSLIAGNLLVIVSGLAIFSGPAGGFLGVLVKLLAIVPFFAIAAFLMVPNPVAKFLMKYLRPTAPPVVPAFEMKVTVPPGQPKAPEPPKAGPAKNEPPKGDPKPPA